MYKASAPSFAITSNVFASFGLFTYSPSLYVWLVFGLINIALKYHFFKTLDKRILLSETNLNVGLAKMFCSRCLNSEAR